MNRLHKKERNILPESMVQRDLLIAICFLPIEKRTLLHYFIINCPRMWQTSLSIITNVKSVKCLKQVLRCASSWSFIIVWKCEWYMCAYTLNRRLKIVLTTSRKLGGKGDPMATKIVTKTYDQTKMSKIKMQLAVFLFCNEQTNYQASGGIYFHHRAGLLSNPSGTPHILAQTPR